MIEGIEKLGTITYGWAVLSVLGASGVSFYTIWLHLKNYRRPDLQRVTIRILLMIPVYGLSTIVSLNSRYASFFIDTVRDCYEAFVIYSFFILLINYLDGERAILERLRGRLRQHHLWPFRQMCDAIDMSDPITFLKIQQGVLQFVVLKPMLAILIMVLNLFDCYREGYIGWQSSFLWLSLAYNASVCIAMYWLVMFYVGLAKDLKPYRPVPKFICVKSIIFLTFWQGLLIAFLSWAGVLSESAEEYSSNMNISRVYQDAVLCIEMPLFAWMHWYAFPWTDYNDSRLSSRLQIYYAIRDCLGAYDIVWDTKHAFPSITSFFTRRNAVELRDDDEDRLLSRGNPSHQYEIEVDSELEFKIDPREDQDYVASRSLVFGDFHFPVIHDDHRNPPDVQVILNKNATQFYGRLSTAESRESLRAEQSAPVDLWVLDEQDDIVAVSSQSLL